MQKQYSNIKIIIFVILVAITAIKFNSLTQLLMNLGSFMQKPLLGPLIFMFAIIIAILVSPIPSSPLAILGGAIYGPLLGMLYTLVSATIGAVLAFLIARFFLRDYLKKYLEENNFYEKIRGKNNRNIAYFVFLTRLMPQVSFDIVSYAAGITGVSVLVFALATSLGMIPIVFILTFSGSYFQEYLIYILIVLFIFFVAYMLHKYLQTKKHK